MKKTVIVDLNGFLLHRVHRRDAQPLLANPTLASTAADCGNFFIWVRPGAQEFLSFLLDHLHVGVWTSGNSRNVQYMLREITTPEMRRRFLFIWDQSHCVVKPFPPRMVLVSGQVPLANQAERKNKGRFVDVFTKPLAKVVDAFPDQVDPSNVLLVDDSPEKSMENPPALCFSPTSWQVTSPDHGGDLLAGGSVREWFHHLAQFSGSVAEFTHEQ